MADAVMPCRCPLCRTPPYAFAALLALGACAAEAPSHEQLEHRFTGRPVHVVASSDFPDECIDSIIRASDYFRARAVTMTMRIADPLTTPELNGLGRSGVIAVLPDSLPMTPTQKVHGETRFARTVLGDILGAEISLDGCDELATTHEFGHALGLEHFDLLGNLMHRNLDFAGWELTGEQLRWIAD